MVFRDYALKYQGNGAGGEDVEKWGSKMRCELLRWKVFEPRNPSVWHEGVEGPVPLSNVGCKSIFNLFFSENEFTKTHIRSIWKLYFAFCIIGVLCTVSVFWKLSPVDVEVRAEERVELTLLEHITFPWGFCIPCCRLGSEPFYLESRNDMGGIYFCVETWLYFIQLVSYHCSWFLDQAQHQC